MSMNKESVKSRLASAKTKKRVMNTVSYVARLLFLIAISYIVLYPLLYMILSSITQEDAFISSRRIWLPDNVTFDFYPKIMEIID